MNSTIRSCALALAALCLSLAGCAVKPYDYSNFRAHEPRSILVLPPLNNSTTIAGTYSWLSTISTPLAELGYYVYPVAVIDQYLKENGMPTAGEMQDVSLAKVQEIIGADAVLYTTLDQYGTKFQLVSSTPIVQLHSKLIDVRTGTILWDGAALVQQASGGSGNILADAVAAMIMQAVNSKTDPAHNLSRLANAQMLYASKRGLPYGPYSPKFNAN